MRDLVYSKFLHPLGKIHVSPTRVVNLTTAIITSTLTRDEAFILSVHTNASTGTCRYLRSFADFVPWRYVLTPDLCVTVFWACLDASSFV